MNIVLQAVTIGVGIDTARYGHRVTFLKADRQPAAPPLDVLESAAGYEQLRQPCSNWRSVSRTPGSTCGSMRRDSLPPHLSLNLLASELAAAA